MDSGYAAGLEQLVNFSFRSVYFVRMKPQFSSIPYSTTTGHGDRSVRLVEFDQKVNELFRLWYAELHLLPYPSLLHPKGVPTSPVLP